MGESCCDLSAAKPCRVLGFKGIKRINKSIFDCIITILDLLQKLPNNEETRVLRHHLSKSCTSSGANYRATCRPKSINDMIHKLKIVEERLDESMFWLELVHRRFPKIQNEIYQYVPTDNMNKYKGLSVELSKILSGLLSSYELKTLNFKL